MLRAPDSELCVRREILQREFQMKNGFSNKQKIMNFGMVFTMEIGIGDKLMSLRWRVGEVFEMHYTLSVVMSHTDLVCPRGMFSNPIRPVKTSTDFEMNFQ